MPRSLYPHRRHVNFDAPLYAALTQAASWRRVSLAAYIRGAVEVATRAEYTVRGLVYPTEVVAVLPGQLTFDPPDPRRAADVAQVGPEQPRITGGRQGILDPEGQAAVKAYFTGQRSTGYPVDSTTNGLPTGEDWNE